MNPTAKKNSRPHIFEIDLIRAITVFSVVAVHSLSYTSNLTPHTLLKLYNFLGHSLHYNREMFMFVTGLVLTYVYFHREFSVKQFWLKRFMLVFIPYVLWTLLYVFLNNHNLSFFNYLKLFLIDTLNGNASFQLYYILLTLQFYAIFPLFLTAIKKVATHPWITLAVSLLIQITFIYFDFHYLQNGSFKRIPAVKNFVEYQDRIVIIYQFFFILGAYAAIYMDSVQKFIIKYKNYIPVLFVLSYISYYLYFGYELSAYKLSFWNASSVLQPSVILYSIVMIVFFCYLAMRWAKKRRLYRIVSLISDTSFGIYFVHVLFLGYITRLLLPLLPSPTPFYVKDIFVLISAFSISALFCYILLKTPLLSWTIGRARPVASPVQTVKLATVKVYEHRLVRKIVKVLSVIVLVISSYILLTMQLSSTSNSIQNKNFPNYTGMKFMTNSYTPSTSTEKLPPINRPISSKGCAASLQVPTGKSTTSFIFSSGGQRAYTIFIPNNFNNAVPHPLILDFHGYASNAHKEEVISKFDSIAQQNSILMVYPQGTADSTGARGWNTGLHKSITSNDILFVSNMLNHIQQQFCIDPQKIYATGFSNGGGFVNKLTCYMSNRIAAFAPVSGSYIISQKKCTYKKPFSIIEFHGTRDKTVPYNGNKKREELSVTRWASQMATHNNCNRKPQITYISKHAVGYSYEECKDDSAIVYYKILGENHIWPKILFKAADGQDTSKNAASLIWSFFKAHPLQISHNLPSVS